MSTCTSCSSSSPASIQATAQDAVSSEKQALNELAKSLRSGDLQGAQKAFGNLQTLLGDQGGETVQQDVQTLKTALDSGNLKDAQTAFSTLRKDIRGVVSQAGAGGVRGAAQDADGDSDGGQRAQSQAPAYTPNGNNYAVPGASTFSVYG